MKYIVSRTKTAQQTPVGMNHIVFSTDSKLAAKRVLNATDSGVDTWGKVNPDFGVVLFELNPLTNNFVAVAAHGISIYQ